MLASFSKNFSQYICSVVSDFYYFGDSALFSKIVFHFPDMFLLLSFSLKALNMSLDVFCQLAEYFLLLLSYVLNTTYVMFEVWVTSQRLRMSAAA
jgi:hypothetical protein